MKDYLPPYQALLTEKSILEKFLGEENKISSLMLFHGLNLKFGVFYPISRGIPELQQCPFVHLALLTLEPVGLKMVSGEGKTALVGRSLVGMRRQIPYTEGFTALQPFKS